MQALAQAKAPDEAAVALRVAACLHQACGVIRQHASESGINVESAVMVPAVRVFHC